jgi:hypothetical protein
MPFASARRNQYEAGWIYFGDSAMGDRANLMRTLVSFALLREAERKVFISQMNEFLLASPKIRQRIVEEWREHAEGHRKPTAGPAGDCNTSGLL